MIPYDKITVLYNTIWYLKVCYRTIQYPILLYCSVSYCAVRYSIIQYYYYNHYYYYGSSYMCYMYIFESKTHFPKCIVPYHTLPYRIVPYPIVLCCILPEPVWENVLYHIVSHHNVPYCTIPCLSCILYLPHYSQPFLLRVWSIPSILSVLSSAPTSTQCSQSCNLNRIKRHCMEMFLHTATSGWLFMCWYFEAVKGFDIYTPHIKRSK